MSTSVPATRPDDQEPSASVAVREARAAGGSPLELAARIFAAIEAGDVDTVAALWDEGIAVWHNTDGIEQTKTENLRTLAWMARTTASRSYREVRRHETPIGFAQQHVLHLTFPDGRVADLPAALFVEVRDGRVTRIDEYLDTASVSAAFGPASSS
jgi:ketosteroid isomerase-like protein